MRTATNTITQTVQVWCRSGADGESSFSLRFSSNCLTLLSLHTSTSTKCKFSQINELLLLCHPPKLLFWYLNHVSAPKYVDVTRFWRLHVWWRPFWEKTSFKVFTVHWVVFPLILSNRFKCTNLYQFWHRNILWDIGASEDLKFHHQITFNVLC